MTPYSVREFYVFGMLEDAWFKMASVDAEGNWIESRYSAQEMTSTMTYSEREGIWDAATINSSPPGHFYGYSIYDVSMCSKTEPTSASHDTEPIQCADFTLAESPIFKFFAFVGFFSIFYFTFRTYQRKSEHDFLGKQKSYATISLEEEI